MNQSFDSEDAGERPEGSSELSFQERAPKKDNADGDRQRKNVKKKKKKMPKDTAVEDEFAAAAEANQRVELGAT